MKIVKYKGFALSMHECIHFRRKLSACLVTQTEQCHVHLAFGYGTSIFLNALLKLDHPGELPEERFFKKRTPVRNTDKEPLVTLQLLNYIRFAAMGFLPRDSRTSSKQPW